MNFVSVEFVAFLVVVFLLFIISPAKIRFSILLLASYLFYASWSVAFIGIILFSTSVDYFLSFLIYESKSSIYKRLLLMLGIGINLGVLGYFKYVNFFLGSVHYFSYLFSTSLPLPKSLQIILPLGISFYTFEAISYLVDVYRKKPPAKSWLEYNFYIMYFPHLLSGPIIRFQEFQEQLKAKWLLPSACRITQGLELIILGFIFKKIIADSTVQLVDPVFASSESAGSLASVVAVLGFTVQIYFDFMGYTHIARGASLLFNLELPVNFNHPYLACNIREFWNCWHISLSRWIRDYIYIPMGGSKGLPVQTMSNLICTMLIAGAWHGAGWTYICWGGYHGLLLAAVHGWDILVKLPYFDILNKILQKIPATITHVLGVVFTFAFVAIGWILFRASDFPTAINIFYHIMDYSRFSNEVALSIKAQNYIQISQVFILLSLCFCGPWLIHRIGQLYRPLPFWLKTQLACFLAMICWFLTGGKQIPFIYFQF